MQKIKLLTDSACDLPQELADRYDIQIIPIPITIDGQGYYERVDFTCWEFYDRLAQAKELPSTSHVTNVQFLQYYEEIYQAGYTDIVHVTINSKGSNMFQAANMATEMFFEEHPDAREQFHIYVVDSLGYTFMYGQALLEMGRKKEAGASAQELAQWMEDQAQRVVVYFAPYTLEYAKRSGRINCAAAFVGEVLGLRPIIRIHKGDMTIVEKVRGDRNVVQRIRDQYLAHGDLSAPYTVLHGKEEAPGHELAALLEKKVGRPPEGVYPVGACIAINAGPRLAAVVGLLKEGEE